MNRYALNVGIKIRSEQLENKFSSLSSVRELNISIDEKSVNTRKNNADLHICTRVPTHAPIKRTLGSTKMFRVTLNDLRLSTRLSGEEVCVYVPDDHKDSINEKRKGLHVWINVTQSNRLRFLIQNNARFMQEGNY